MQQGIAFTDQATCGLQVRGLGVSDGLEDLAHELQEARVLEQRRRAAQAAGLALRADLLVDLYVEMAKQSLEKAKAAVAAGGNDPAELQRFVNDSECLVLTAEYYRLKVRAALAKRLLELTGGAKYATELRALMTESVAKYEAMFTHARKFYRAGSSMFDAKPWERAFNEKVKMDAELQEKWLAEFLSRKR